MHSGYQQPDPENSPNNYDQRHLFLDHFHYAGGGASSYFPAKLGLNSNKDVSGDVIVNACHGSERFNDVPEARQPSLGVLHCWQDSPIKQLPPFWEHRTLLSQVSNENIAISDKRSQQHFGELEAIYKPLVATADDTNPCEINEEEEEEKVSNKKRKKRNIRHMMAEFFGGLVKQVVDHQENMHKRFAEVMDGLEEERKAREEDWRKREAERLQQQSEEREREKASAKGREAVIVSYLERITGERILGGFSELDPTEINNVVILTYDPDNTAGDDEVRV